MAFDPSSAQPTGTGFDATGAQPVGASTGFDPTSAQPVPTEAFGAKYGGGIWGGVEQVAHGLQGAYKEAVTNGLMMQPVRAVMEGAGYGMDDLKQRFPGQTDDWYHKTLHNAYGTAVDLSRQQATQEVQDNPYPGQTVGNFGASVVGHPEQLLMGGAGVGKSVVGRITNAALKNAGIAGLSDIAAQGMDLLEGQKKDYDVTQSLEQAAGGALIGGGMHGVFEAAPFVKSLFSNRGMDTTPGADPRGGQTVPTTGDQLALNAQDHAEYMKLLNTGSVDDIKQFMQGKQGPQPSWTDVNKWVEHRDALADQGVNAKMTNPDFNYENEYNRQTIESHVNDQLSGWKNAPDVNVVHGPDDITDPALKQSAMQQGAQSPNSLGFFGPDGSVHIFSGRIADAAKLTGMSPGEMTNSVLFHEGLGHYGLQQQFGAKLDSTIQTLLTRNVGQFGRDVDAWQKSNPRAYGGNRIRAAEEVLANKSNGGVVAPSVMDALGSAVRQFGRKLGMKLTYSDAEVSQIVRQSQQAVTDGKGRDVRGNGFKFMFTGPSSAGFDPASATAFDAADGVTRNEISDKNAIIRQLPPENGAAKLGDIIDHPDLFSAYPHLRDLPVLHTKMEGLEGAYSPKTHMMYLNSAADDAGKLSTILHETQHAIQVHEGYPGTDEETANKEMSVEDYLNHPIEKEAYATEDRLNMSTDDRVANGVKFATISDIVGPDKALKAAVDDNYVKDTRTLPEIKRNALELGVSPSDVKNLNQSQLATLVHRLGTAGDIALARIDALNDKIGTANETVADRAAYLKTLADLNQIIPSFLGNASEAGRAMRVVQAFPSFTSGGLKALAEHLAAEGSGLAGLADDPVKFYQFQQAIKKLMQGGNPQGALVKMQAVNKPYLEQYINTFHFNAMLSSLGTQFKAMRDMMTGIGTDAIERAISVPIGLGRNMYEGLTGKTQVQGVHPTEVAGNLFGIIRSIADMETYRATLHSAMTGDSSYVVNGQRTPTNVASNYGIMSNPNIPGVSIPTQLISAHDTFFRSVAMNQNLYSLGYREAVRSGLRSIDDIMTAGAGYARSPTPSMLREAQDLTNRTLLLNSNPINKILDKSRIYTPGMTIPQRIGAFVVQNLAPFIRVESNSLFNRVIQRSPLALLDPYTRAQINAGGAQSDIAMAKILYGSAKIGMYWAAAGLGDKLLTGNGPDNVNKYKENLAAGITPNSAHVGDQFNRSNLPMQLNPFGLQNTNATMVKNMRDAFETGANKGQVATGVALAMASVMHDMASESWINDFKPAMDAALAKGNTGGQAVASFAGQEAKSFVPAILGQTAKQMNPNTLDTRPNPTAIPGVPNVPGQMFNDMAASIPGNPAGLPDKNTVYGNPQPNGAGLFENGHSVETHDPAEQELHRISGLSPTEALITPVKREKGMTTSNYEQYQRLAGRAIVESVRQEMQSPSWQSMSDTDKWFEIKSIQKDMKKAAKEQVFGTP